MMLCFVIVCVCLMLLLMFLILCVLCDFRVASRRVSRLKIGYFFLVLFLCCVSMIIIFMYFESCYNMMFVDVYCMFVC